MDRGKVEHEVKRPQKSTRSAPNGDSQRGSPLPYYFRRHKNAVVEKKSFRRCLVRLIYSQTGEAGPDLNSGPRQSFSSGLLLTAFSSAPRIRSKLCERARACTCLECSTCCLNQFDRNDSSFYEYSKFYSKIVG